MFTEFKKNKTTPMDIIIIIFLKNNMLFYVYSLVLQEEIHLEKNFKRLRLIKMILKFDARMIKHIRWVQK